jgi:hypothetical protein
VVEVVVKVTHNPTVILTEQMEDQVVVQDKIVVHNQEQSLVQAIHHP